MYSFKIPAINKLLNLLASQITDDKFQEMKFLLTEVISPAELEQCIHPRDVFTKLKQRCLIGEHNLESLENLFDAMDLNHLTVKVQEFKDRIASDGGVNDIPEQQTAALPAPHHALATLLIDQAFAEFNPTVISNVRQSISEALGVDIGRVNYLLTRPHSSYYMCFQLPEKLVECLLQAAKSKYCWLSNLRCLEVQINNLPPIQLKQHQESMIEPECIQMDASDPCCDDLVTDGSRQDTSFQCRFQEPEKQQVIFTFRGSLKETEVTLDKVEGFRLDLCANLNCPSSTQIYYLEFSSGPDIHHMSFSVPQCYFETLNFCSKESKEWLKEMNIFEIHTRNVSSRTMTAIYRSC